MSGFRNPITVPKIPVDRHQPEKSPRPVQAAFTLQLQSLLAAPSARQYELSWKNLAFQSFSTLGELVEGL